MYQKKNLHYVRQINVMLIWYFFSEIGSYAFLIFFFLKIQKLKIAKKNKIQVVQSKNVIDQLSKNN